MQESLVFVARAYTDHNHFKNEDLLQLEVQNVHSLSCVQACVCLHVCMCVCVLCVYISAGAHRTMRSLKLELLVAESHLMWMLGVEPGSSEEMQACSASPRPALRSWFFVSSF